MVTTVTTEGWNVSTRTGSYFEGAVLDVFKGFSPEGKTRKGDAYGKQFVSTAEANRYAIEHGYCEPYRDPAIGSAKKIYRQVLVVIMTAAMRKILEVDSVNDVASAANYTAARIHDECGLSRLRVLRWSNSVYYLARKFRPEIYEQNERRIAFGEALHRRFAITAEIAGLSMEDILSWMDTWEDNADDAVEAYGSKYNLTAVREVSYG